MLRDPKTVEAEYARGLQFLRRSGYLRNWPLFGRMRAGDQWAKPTERTRNLPRPVFNIIDLFIGVKTSEVLRGPVALCYGGGPPARPMTDAAAFIWGDTDQESLCQDLLEDAATYGTGILHYYLNPATGRIRGEALDPRCVVFADPAVREVQSQRYITVATEMPTDLLREQARALGLAPSEIDRIRPAESEGEDRTLVLTRYSRDRQGRCVFCRVASGVLLVPDTPLGDGISLYPLEVMSWRRRRDGIHGIGEAETIVPNQRAINFLMAMLLLSVQGTAWPKLVVREGALRALPTNTPGEVLTDYSPEGDGIRYLTPPAYPAQALEVVDKLYELTRLTSGVSEVLSGEPFSRTASAQAIHALQMQAKVPLQSVRARYHRALVGVGRIWAQFCGMSPMGGPALRCRVETLDREEVNPREGDDHTDRSDR